MPIESQSFLRLLLLSFFTLSHASLSFFPTITGGNWVLLQESIGISAMHLQLLKTNQLIIFDRTDFGPSNLSFPNPTKCLRPNDCTAHSVLYDLSSDTFRPLTLLTNTWCSSGSLDPNGTLIQTGGEGKGERAIRAFAPCDGDDSCDWVELLTPLSFRRWYATDHILPDGRVIIVGGRRVFTYEFYPKNSQSRDNVILPFLIETKDPQEENNLYPFLHLLPDGNLFIFANNRSILLDYNNHKVVKEYPVMPGGARNFPCTGSSVLLPLRLTIGKEPDAEVMICGGAQPGAYIKARVQHVYDEASRTCGRLRVTDPDPKWVIELMPTPRVMNDMILLPSGDVIIINGAANGSAGWNTAVNPVFYPVLYAPETGRFIVLNPTRIPRMYHSTAGLLPDGRVVVGGSNPHPTYNFTAEPYKTELSLEAFYPPYLNPLYSYLRPEIMTVGPRGKTVSYNEMFDVTFLLTFYRVDLGISVVIVTPSFSTHSFEMNQRMVVLNVMNVERLTAYGFKVNVIGPTNVNVAPPGYYMLFVVNAGIPSHAVWVQVR